MRVLSSCLASLLLLTANLSATQEDDGFVSLFNGQDLDGWVAVNTAPSTWQIREEGILHCTGKPIGELRTARMYQNFILELEWRHLVPGGNAGVFVWADDITAKGVPFHRSIEVQVLDHAYGKSDWFTTHGDIFPIHGARMTPENGRGGSRAFPTEERSNGSPEWNHYRITCIDGDITLAVNGEVVTRGKACSPARGYICLESEGGEVDYRNLRIRELPSGQLAPKDVAIADRGYETLYTGVDLSGLQAEGTWNVSDWRLVHPAGEGKLTTERSFGNFGFVLDVNRTDDGPLVLKLRGSEAAQIQLDFEKGWHRIEGELRGPWLWYEVNGERVQRRVKLEGVPGTGPMVIEGSGGTQLANFFAREVTKEASPALLEIPDVHEDEQIAFALYTVHENTLKMTAQLYPLVEGQQREVSLELWTGDDWRGVERAPVIEPGYTAHFRVDLWNDSLTTHYRLRHGPRAAYQGIVRANPTSDEVVMAAFSCNSIHPSHGGDIDKSDLVSAVQAVDADLVFFAGDQVYDHHRHLAAWLRFGRDFGEILRDRPSITIPDDHDVGQANLWGHGGKKASNGAGPDGGYFKPVAYVQEVERAQTSHLPDPFDPTPVDRGIGVYYTDLVWGGVSFAILEDRKWKTGPEGLIPRQGPRPDHIRNPEYDPASVDVPEARLLGERQLTFLDHWARDWEGAELKVALSQTIFCGGAHLHGKYDGRLHADLDSNGWPQTGRNKAVAALRRARAWHVAGDQHLATVFHHGIDHWNDAIWSFCTPAIANLYLRWWEPLEEGRNRQPGQDAIFGEHVDGFGNKVTAWAAANPTRDRSDPAYLTTRSAGFGVVRIHKPDRAVTFECWPRNTDPTSGAGQYAGWPIRVEQGQNDGREIAGYLPEVVTRSGRDPVVEVIDAGGELVYALRGKDGRFLPPVYAPGSYSLRVDGVLHEGIDAGDPGRTLEVD